MFRSERNPWLRRAVRVQSVDGAVRGAAAVSFPAVPHSECSVPFKLFSRHLITFLVSLCAIIGGVFTVAQLIDTMIYHSSRVIEKKLSLNKLG